MTPRRIALVADPASTHTRVWLSGLVARGHEVHLFSPHKAPPPDDLPGEICAPLAPSRADAASRGVTPAPDAPRAMGSSLELRRITRALRLAPSFRAWLQALAPDALIALRLQPEGYLAAMGGFHPFGVVSWGQDVLRFAEAHALHRFFSRRVVDAADRLWGETEAVLEGYRRLGAREDRLSLVYTGIDLACWRRPIEAELVLELEEMRCRHPEWSAWLDAKEHRAPIVFSPRAVARAGHQRELLEAWAADREAHLLLAGAGDAEERAHLQARARALGVADRVHDLGLLSPRELRVVYWIADLVASLWSPDGLSQTLLEAMAAGALVLAADLPGNRAWIEPRVNGLLVSPVDGAALREVLGSALRDARLAHEVGIENERRMPARADRARNLDRWVEEVEALR